MSPSGPPTETGIPNTLPSSQSGHPQPTAVSHFALLKPGHAADPSLVFSGYWWAQNTYCNKSSSFMDTILCSGNFCRLHASLEILGLRGQSSFNQGLTMEWCFLSLLSSQETPSTLGQMRTPSAPPLEGSQRVLGVRGSSLT